MTKFLLPLIAFSVVTPVLAAPVQQRQPMAFERNGIHYIGTVKTIGETTLIEGREVESGTTFQLRTRNGYVSGIYGTTQVSYAVPR